MFTPPPSPLPPQIYSSDPPTPTAPPEPSLSAAKKRKTSRIRWSILAVPAVLVIITLTSRCISHPVLLDWISALPHESRGNSEFDDWGLHKPHHSPQHHAGSHVARANDNATPTTTTVPTIPVNLPVPTPFPQPFDTTISKNFSTEGCADFYNNMTLSLPFRRCRPFGLLAEYSSQFIQAQTNITLLNDVVWGTCNTTLDSDTCSQNMNWFASSLKTQCATELSQRNSLVQNTLSGLDLFTVSRQAGCLSNPDSNVYCYIQAAAQPTASDIYFYQILSGIMIPNNTVPSCSSCTKSLMSLYMTAVSTPGDINDDDVRSSLAQAYVHAADVAAGVCGNGFVEQLAINGSGSLGRSLSLSSLCFAFFIGCISMVF